MSEISFSSEYQQDKELESEILEKARKLLKRGKKTYELLNFDAFPISEPIPGLSFKDVEPDARFEIIDQPSYSERKRRFLRTQTIHHPATFFLTLHLRPKERKAGEGICYTLAFPENSMPHVVIYPEVTSQTFYTLLGDPKKAFDFRILRQGLPGRGDLMLFKDVLDMILIMDREK